MQTQLTPDIRDTPQGREAESILRQCVHCGFCNAACPTYQVTGDELDGPRGRIYLMKQMLEGASIGSDTMLHLDRCLTCRSCETACPSGVEYGKLLDIGRETVEHKVARPWRQNISRYLLRQILPRRRVFAALLTIARLMKAILPIVLRQKIPAATPLLAWPAATHKRHMLILQGCVQPALAPNINAHAARVLDKLGIRLIPVSGCCGAISQHLAATDEARATMRHNIDNWWPHIEAGAEALVMTASGCGVQLKDYGYLLRDDARYAAKAARVSALTKDIAEILQQEDLQALVFNASDRKRKVAYQAPCTLQHGQKLPGLVEGVLLRLGLEPLLVADAHLCCGSAGTYSLLQAEISVELRDHKLAALNAHAPELIATSNIGCLCHLQAASHTPVVHWLELLG
jgi:glycolate oxidase iron-sulfur subunit